MAPTPGINELEQLSDFRTSPTSLPESSVLSGDLRADLFSPSLQASRQAARALDVDDTLPPAVEILKDMMEKAFGITEAAPAFARLAEGLDAEDRTAALQVFLRPPRS